MILGFVLVAAQQLVLEMRFEVRGFESHLKQFFLFNTFLNTHCIAKVTNTELRDINRLMGCRDAQ